MLGYKFGSDESIDMIEQIVRAKFKSELETEIMMAQERGTFPDYNIENEWCNQWFDFIESEFPELAEAMKKYGRRNLSWSTVNQQRFYIEIYIIKQINCWKFKITYKLFDFSNKIDYIYIIIITLIL